MPQHPPPLYTTQNQSKLPDHAHPQGVVAVAQDPLDGVRQAGNEVLGEVPPRPDPLDGAEGLGQVGRVRPQRLAPLAGGEVGDQVEREQPRDEALGQGVVRELAQEAGPARAGGGQLRPGGRVVEHLVGVAVDVAALAELFKG